MGEDVYKRVYGLLVSDDFYSAAFCPHMEGLRDDHFGEITVGDLVGRAIHVPAAYRNAVTCQKVVYKLFKG